MPPSSQGRLWHCVSEASSEHPASSPYHDLSFSRPFLEDGAWTKVQRNVRRACQQVPPDLRAGVFFNRPHGQFRNIDGDWEIRLDAWQLLRRQVNGEAVFGAGVQTMEVRGLLDDVADVGAYAACLASISEPVLVYLGWEPDELDDVEDQSVATNLIADMLAPELAAKAARGGRPLIVGIDGIISRQWSAWILRRMAKLGLVPAVEGLPPPGSMFDDAGTIAIGTYMDFIRSGDVEAIEDRACKSAIIYEPENGATPAVAATILRAGGDVIIPFEHADVGQIVETVGGRKPSPA